MNDELHEALYRADFDRATELLVAGADINAFTKSGGSILSSVIGIIGDMHERYAVVRFMLEHGADPNLLDKGCGPLMSTVFVQDTEVFRLLLDNGADPNIDTCDSDCESLYDLAEFDYRYETFRLRLPEEPEEVDKTSEEMWLRFLDRIAIKYGKRRPDYVILLRERGALTYNEQKSIIT